MSSGSFLTASGSVISVKTHVSKPRHFFGHSKASLPSRALKAGSTLPPLALSTALMTVSSTVGNASFKIMTFFWASVSGRGGFGGAVSAGESCAVGPVFRGFAFGGVIELVLGPGLAAVLLSERALVSCTSSSSISSGRAVVGDSAPLSVAFLFCSIFYSLAMHARPNNIDVGTNRFGRHGYP